MKLPKLSLLSVVIASYISFPAIADETPTLDEVVVTAQKRVQKMEDVPISLTALNGAKLEETGITSIAGIADYTPSFNMTQTGIGTNIAIRGISSGVNQGFEQSAAMFVDGIHYGRAQLARAPFLDIERIEILRGPQSILFGKNSTAGAISIINAKPGKEFEGSLNLSYEPEFEEKEARLVLSGPISDTVGGRMAILSRKTDGFIENTTLDRNESADKDQVIRATLEWKPTDTWDITLKLEDGSFDSNGRNIEVIKPVTNSALNTTKDPNPYKTILSYLTAGAFQLDTTEDGKRQSNGDYSYNDTNNITLTAEHDIGGMTLTSVTGYNGYTYSELCDCDFTGASGFNIYSDEKYRQVSQELRLTSAADQKITWIGGLFYQGSNIKFHDKVFVPTNSVIATAVSPLLRGASTQRDFNQDTSLYAVFGQVTWNITDTNRLILGGRYSSETKDADRAQYHVSPTGDLLPLGTVNDPYNKLWVGFKVDPHNVKGDRSESGFDPQIIFQQDINKTDRLYASYTTGFKSGGYDVRANSAPTALGGLYPGNDTNGSWEFEKEDVKNYELGGKFLLASGSAELNIALFRSDFTNMQTSQFDGSLSFNVTNAGEARVQGLEVDGRWAITSNLLMRGGASYLDFEYLDFPNGQCAFGQAANSGPTACDQTGMRREFVPKYQGNVGWDYDIDLPNGWKLANTLDVVFNSGYLTTPSLDSRFEQSSYTKINARIALSGADEKWEVALVGKNLTDESVITYANGLPVASVLTKGAGSGFYAFYEPARSVAIQGTIKF
ncbi:TonB-dependent receptor [Cellvibrio zantedeschiae]|uniref:TonB-dependent receptor n=1 Tax=Cellvibrio zantedeschiae TaxID=1237077 RepID=A0ABQ3AN97_9GAMM|nr:TonB-dependent receptor [Cellvibrio zantedeschiae]GGY62691.1 TonB-dependent receptor [Cellvibrio zantedeschiae]